MPHRFGPVIVLLSALTFPLVANAQVPHQAPWLGPSRPQNAPNAAYPQPAYPQGTYLQPAYPQGTYPQAYNRPVYDARPYPAAPGPTPAAYHYAGYPAYANQAPAFGAPPAAYSGQYPATNYAYGGAAPVGPSAAAEARGPLVSTKDNLHYVEMGMGAFVPTDQGNTAKVGLEASLWAIHGGWIPNSGLYLTLDASTGFDIGCMAKRATDGCKGHLRIHWIGAGPFFNTGTPMIAGDVPRSWDLMALTGAEVRVWKGMTVKTTLNWFLPSPWGVYAYEKELTEARLNGAAATASTTSAGSIGAEAESFNPMDRVESILGHALKHPQLNLMAMWEF